MSERQLLTRESFKTGSTNVDYERLLEEALTMPGQMGSTYNRFYEYSFGNQVALFMQGVEEPVNTYKRWGAMNRQVKRGSKAKAIMVPLLYRGEDKDGNEEMQMRGVKWLNCLFTLSETEGEELPPYEPPEWNRERALGALGVTEVLFRHTSGNVQGYAKGNELAINPVAAYPLKTTFHELGHIVLKHTTNEGLEEYQQHRGLMEFQAESIAYLGMNEIGAAAAMNAAESRAYIQNWLRGQEPEDKHIRPIFSGTDRIVKAGRVALKEVSDEQAI